MDCIKNFFKNRIFLKILKYLVSLIIGIIITFIAYFIPEHWSLLKDLLIGVSSTFFSLVLLAGTYELFMHWSEKRLNFEIHNYVNTQIEIHLFKILQKINSIINNATWTTFGCKNNLLQLSLADLENKLSQKEIFYGFQIFVDWNKFLFELDDLLNNNLVTKYLSNDETTSILLLRRAYNQFVHQISAVFNYFMPTTNELHSGTIKIEENGEIWIGEHDKGEHLIEYLIKGRKNDFLRAYHLHTSNKANEIANVIYTYIKEIKKHNILRDYLKQLC
ncbi:TPA: hypothetical protein ACMGHF_000536 [Legionella pneumophila]|nr:hypothetical protein [Legionella pneumophila]